MLKRSITTIIAFPIFIFLLLKGGIYTFGLTFAIAFVALDEFYNGLKVYGEKPINLLGYIFLIFILFGLFLELNYYYFLCILFISCFILLVINLFSKDDRLVDSGSTILGIIYIGVGFSHLILLSHFRNEYIILLPFLISWGSDTFAYFAGRLFGKNKLFERVSPKKTIEGAIGGLFGAVLINIVFAYFFIKDLVLIVAIISLFGSALSQIGDLMASRVKRIFGIKDFGNLLPGHGGVLDRFDSSLVTIPFVFYCIYVYNLFI